MKSIDNISLGLSVGTQNHTLDLGVGKSRSISGDQVILYLGDRVLENILDLGQTEYHFLRMNTAKELCSSIKRWKKSINGQPVAIIVDDQSLPQLLLEEIVSLKNKGIFKGVPVFAFAKQRDRVALSAIDSLHIDDYEPYPINLESLAAKISVFKSLKKVGISTQGIASESDFDPDKKIRIWSNKRIFDILVSLTCLILVSPILLLIILAIKAESKGPIFYISKRAGRNYKVFDFYKFRSMYKDADAKLALLKETQNQYKDGNQFVKIKNDPRITRVGRFLRNTSLDEVPQLLNVLKGDMSIVGNRPLPLYEAELLTVDDHAERFLGPAGITGLWQVLKRGKDDMSSEERILLDRVYARKNSLTFDLRIVLMTFPALFQSEKV